MHRDTMTEAQKLAGIRPTLPGLAENEIKKRMLPHMWVISKDSTGAYIVTIGDPKRHGSTMKQRFSGQHAKSELKLWARDTIGRKLSADHVLDVSGLKLVPDHYSDFYMKMQGEAVAEAVVDLDEEVRPGQYFVLVDTSVPGDKLVSNKLYHGVKGAEAAWKKLTASGRKVQIIDAKWFKPSYDILYAQGMVGKPWGEGVEDGDETLDEILARVNNPDILDFIRKKGEVTPHTVSMAFSTGDKDIKRRLDVLVKKGTLKKTGRFSYAMAEDMQEAEVDAAYAKTHAVTDQAGFQRIFDSLKSKQVVWLSFSAVMSTASKDFRPFTVGRRSHSKKYNVTSLTMLHAGQAKPTHRGFQTKLMKRGNGNVSIALGDMGASLLGMFVQKGAKAESVDDLTEGAEEFRAQVYRLDPDPKAFRKLAKKHHVEIVLETHQAWNKKGGGIQFHVKLPGGKYKLYSPGGPGRGSYLETASAATNYGPKGLMVGWSPEAQAKWGKKESMDDLFSGLTERQKETPALAFPDEDKPTRKGAFKVSATLLKLMKKETGYEPDRLLFKQHQKTILDIPRDKLPGVMRKGDMADAQDVIAGKPKQAFQLFMQNIGKVSPKAGKLLRAVPENNALLFYIYMMRVSGRDMADIVLKRYLTTHQAFKPIKPKGEAMEDLFDMGEGKQRPALSRKPLPAKLAKSHGIRAVDQHGIPKMKDRYAPVERGDYVLSGEGYGQFLGWNEKSKTVSIDWRKGARVAKEYKWHGLKAGKQVFRDVDRTEAMEDLFDMEGDSLDEAVKTPRPALLKALQKHGASSAATKSIMRAWDDGWGQISIAGEKLPKEVQAKIRAELGWAPKKAAKSFAPDPDAPVKRGYLLDIRDSIDMIDVSDAEKKRLHAMLKKVKTWRDVGPLKKYFEKRHAGELKKAGLKSPYGESVEGDGESLDESKWRSSGPQTARPQEAKLRPGEEDQVSSGIQKEVEWRKERRRANSTASVASGFPTKKHRERSEVRSEDGPVLLGNTVLAESVGNFQAMAGVRPLTTLRRDLHESVKLNASKIPAGDVTMRYAPGAVKGGSIPHFVRSLPSLSGYSNYAVDLGGKRVTLGVHFKDNINFGGDFKYPIYYLNPRGKWELLSLLKNKPAVFQAIGRALKKEFSADTAATNKMIGGYEPTAF